MIDTTDRDILTILRRNSCTSKAEIARQVGLTPTAVFERIRKLEERGVITGYQAQLDPAAFGMGLLAFVFVTAERPVEEPDLGPTLAGIPGVEEVHVIAGEDCFLLKVRAADTEGLYRLLREEVGTIPTVRGIRTTIVLETVAEPGERAFCEELPDGGAANGERDSAGAGRNRKSAAPRGPRPSLLSTVEKKY
ncbi:MAG: Lrp/AsnC family transcriptional regulator [Gemmatimonadetes bacterium]|nr:Lrp/AsnC family transcriptional regulator [Gemmatimonadota bacterium]